MLSLFPVSRSVLLKLLRPRVRSDHWTLLLQHG